MSCGSENAVEDAMEQQIEEETGGDANVDIDGDAVRIETDDGTFETGSASLPENWPEDVSVYPEGKVTYSAVMNPSTGDSGMAFVITTNDSVEDVTDYYKDQLPADGWTMEAAMEAGTMVVLGGSKGERKVSLMITGSEDQTSVTVSVQE